MAQNLEEFFESCSLFKSTLSTFDDQRERHREIIQFIGKSCESSLSVGDFATGLEWFNCLEPLSLGRQLRGKIVVLDFFTYCCINCLHILPHLKQLEEKYSVETGVVVVGVHSAKFDNEKDSANISAALKRYDVSHPVVNDSEALLWTKLGISCWPTIVILGPKGQPLFQFVGEGHERDLFEFVSAAVDFFGSRSELSANCLPLAPSTSVLKGPLLFPGKITTTLSSDGLEIIAIANSGLHTVIILNSDGVVEHNIGLSGTPGFEDGDFSCAKFNSPQGLAFSSSDTLFVADTENHAIRKVDLKKKCVLTIAGNGLQGSDESGGNAGAAQSLSSPWDLYFLRRKVQRKSLPQPFLCICPPAPQGCEGSQPSVAPPVPKSLTDHPITPPLPPPPPIPSAQTFPPPPPPPIPSAQTFPPPPPPLKPSSAPVPPKLPVPFVVPPPLPPISSVKSTGGETMEDQFEEKEVLLIAMAGSHQIWAYFFQDTEWWGKEYFAAGTCANIAGSGCEANRNNSYPKSAAFAQPSGLTYCAERDELLIADSESSSVRCIDMKSGKVSAVVGGSKIPDDLFCFGDVDGDGFNVRLQHPLGVAWHEKSKALFVADSYNHKVKVVNLEAKSCKTLVGVPPGGGRTNDVASLMQLNEPGGLCISTDLCKIYLADTNNHSFKVYDLTSSSISELKIHYPVPIVSKRPDVKDSDASSISVKHGGRIIFHVETMLPSGVKLTEGAPQRWMLKIPGGDWKVDQMNGSLNPQESLKITLTAPSRGQDKVQDIKAQLSFKLFVCDGGACRAVSSSLNFTITCDINASTVVDQKAVFQVL